MIADATQHILDQIKQLPRQEKFELFAHLERELIAGGEVRSHSLLELQGLGKEVWEGVDVKQYLRDEHDSWSG